MKITNRGTLCLSQESYRKTKATADPLSAEIISNRVGTVIFLVEISSDGHLLHPGSLFPGSIILAVFSTPKDTPVCQPGQGRLQGRINPHPPGQAGCPGSTPGVGELLEVSAEPSCNAEQ